MGSKLTFSVSKVICYCINIYLNVQSALGLALNLLHSGKPSLLGNDESLYPVVTQMHPLLSRISEICKHIMVLSSNPLKILKNKLPYGPFSVSAFQRRIT